MVSTSASAREETQFTHCPAWITPTEKVQASVVISSIWMIRRAISRIAERPVGKPGTGMAGTSDRGDIESRDRVATGGDAALVATRLGHEHHFLPAKPPPL